MNLLALTVIAEKAEWSYFSSGLRLPLLSVKITGWHIWQATLFLCHNQRPDNIE